MLADDWKEEFLGQLNDLPLEGYRKFTASLLEAEGFQDVEVDDKPSRNQVSGSCVYRASLFGINLRFLSMRKLAVTKEHIWSLERSIKSHRDRGLLISTERIGRQLRDYCQKESKCSIDLVDKHSLCQACRNRRIGLSVLTHAVERVGIDLREFGPTAEQEPSPTKGPSLFVFDPGDKDRVTYGKAWQCIADVLYERRNSMGERRNLFLEIRTVKPFSSGTLFAQSEEDFPRWARGSCYPIRLGQQTWFLNTVLSNDKKCRYLRLLTEHAEISFGKGKQIDVGFC